MNTFASNVLPANHTPPVKSNITTTDNGMRAYTSTLSACLDYFYAVGANRSRNLVEDFRLAYAEDKDLAVRLMLWSRDARNGAGERGHFIRTMDWLAENDWPVAYTILKNGWVQSMGRWKDMIEFTHSKLSELALSIFAEAILAKDGLACKWAPRKGPVAAKLRSLMQATPKQYRVHIVSNTNVVETAMCKKEWGTIEFGKVPSRAHSDYRKAFSRNDADRYVAYLESVKKGDAKINAGAIYPYDVIKSLMSGHTQTVLDSAQAQWDALPDFLGDQSVLPVVDISGSMMWQRVTPTLYPIDVAVSMGLYMADKNKGAWKDIVMNFSSEPELVKLNGTLLNKLQQIRGIGFGMSTNLHAVFDRILSHGIQHRVPDSEMPKNIVIFSDMQFDECVLHGDTAIGACVRKYEDVGYTVPRLIFWNLNGNSNRPATEKMRDVVLVSGFSPSLLPNVLKEGFIDPRSAMLDVVMNDRYEWNPNEV